MTKKLNLAILSDVHYASAAERARLDYCYAVIENPLRRLATRLYRHFLWQRDPFAHNYLLDSFIEAARGVDHVIANGDYSCDSAFVGVSDDAAFSSASECLGKLRAAFGPNLHATIGDHELGKKPLAADVGGLRLASYERTVGDLDLPPLWQLNLGSYALIGVVSTLIALPVFEPEALPGELRDWRDLRAAHLERVREAFRAIKPFQRLLLFCHDPTALPWLAAEPAVREKLPQIERTVIGHLHSNLIYIKSRLLCGMPTISFLGHTPRRLSAALRQARYWRPFNLLLCPSLAGIQLLKDGGFYTVELDPTAKTPASFRFQPLQWKQGK